MENVTKLRLLYLYQYLIRNTDSDHPESTAELIKVLKDQYDISVSRKTIADDLTMLHDCGLQIEVIRSTQNKYYYDGQLLSLPELKILIDVISSSKFITERKSEELINKLLSLVPPENVAKLRRHIYASDRVKSGNERGYYIVDAINEAIDMKHKISFFYVDYDINKNRYIANGGSAYTVSPYTLIWDGEYYYLRGYCDERQSIRTFRLDRIDKQPVILNDYCIPQPEGYDLALYSKSVFRMFDTDELTDVTLLCSASVMKAMLDRFGQDVETVVVDKEHFLVKIRVCTSPTFYRWLFGYFNDIKIISPKETVHQYIEMAEKVIEINRKE